MLENQLSRYGAFAKDNAAPIGSKTFFVSDSDDTTVGPFNLGNEFPVDKDGIVRVYTTIQAAVNATSANRGDVIYVLPSYDQTLGRADSWNVASTKIIGLGNGNNRPIIRYTAATDEVGIGASNISVENLRFLAAVDSCARALDLDTGFSGATVKNCVFDFNAAGNDFRVAIRAGQPRSIIENNRFLGEDTAGGGSAVSLRGQGADYTVIKNNFIYGQYDTVGDTSNGAAPISLDTTDTGDTNLSGLVIEGNTIVNTDTAASLMMRIAGGTFFVRGIAKDNYFASYDSATADTSKFVTGLAANQGLRMINNLIGSADSGTERLVNDSTVAHA